MKKHAFKQTLVPVKNAGYRLYVNGPMLYGADAVVGQTVKFVIEQDFVSRRKNYPIPSVFKKELEAHHLLPAFRALTSSRQKDILKYLNSLKTTEALQRNIDKVIGQLQDKKTKLRLP